jgi:hypothetical protein
MTTLITWYKNGSGENSFSPHMLIFSGSKRVTPPLLRCGRQPRGSIPLTPSFLGFFNDLLYGIALSANTRMAGAEAQMYWTPQERRFVSLRDFKQSHKNH